MQAAHPAWVETSPGMVRCPRFSAVRLLFLSLCCALLPRCLVGSIGGFERSVSVGSGAV